MISRRRFLSQAGLITLGATSLPLLVSACSSSDSDPETTRNFAVIRVSSDLHASTTEQRLAFTIFEKQTVAAQGPVPVTLHAPSGHTQAFDEVKLRDRGIKDQGIYSVQALLNEPGPWQLYTKFEGKDLELAFTVAESATAPAIGASIPTIATPTTSNPLDASILCTRFEGNCEFHDHSVEELLGKQKPFIVLFATPARCQTTYCGPVLELTRTVAEKNNLDVAHIEIYKDETSPETLDAVQGWNLPSEPWLFAVNADGTVNARLDGAFDQSEIEETFKALL